MAGNSFGAWWESFARDNPRLSELLRWVFSPFAILFDFAFLFVNFHFWPALFSPSEGGMSEAWQQFTESLGQLPGNPLFQLVFMVAAVLMAWHAMMRNVRAKERETEKQRDLLAIPIKVARLHAEQAILAKQKSELDGFAELLSDYWGDLQYLLAESENIEQRTTVDKQADRSRSKDQHLAAEWAKLSLSDRELFDNPNLDKRTGVARMNAYHDYAKRRLEALRGVAEQRQKQLDEQHIALSEWIGKDDKTK
ncbi:MAG: hypothetical protein RLN87_09850 [Parasphingopyxis sp.]|uniref:hypothetical protein n=1 Tax=Parasphingopyxis sp. TaxID=1920299 RepID=UPI0032EE848B